MQPDGSREVASAPLGLDLNDTIAAVASPRGPAARAIVRLSGPDALSIALAGFTPSEESKSLPGGIAILGPGSLKVTGLRPVLRVTMALWPGPRSYTGGPLAEIHLTGSAPISSLVLSDCLVRGARLAEPGEFTLRAFLAGRIDLTQAEAVLGVIDAGNPAQLAAALQQLAGGLSGPIGALRDRLLDLVAHLEANLDFTEEPDVDPLTRAAMTRELAESAEVLDALARQLNERERPDPHPRVVLVGPPNAGKSRLYNALLNRDRAIVSPHAGTTRDYVSEICDCDGLTIELVDTAGLDLPVDAVTTQAQTVRAEQFARADLLLVCRSVGG